MLKRGIFYSFSWVTLELNVIIVLLGIKLGLGLGSASTELYLGRGYLADIPNS